MAKYRYIILLIVLSNALSTGFGQLKADFKAIPTEGCAPLYVEFQDLSSGNPIKWVWDLGNNTTAEVRNPTNTFFVTGIYTIKLKIFNSAGDSAEMIRNQYIDVTSNPVVDFSASSTEGCAPVTVKFKDLTDPKNGIITKWEWDFGDGNIRAGKEPVHVYKNSGTFNITLKVTNNNGCISFQTKKSFIKINNKPVSDFTSDFTDACSAPASIIFAANPNSKGNLDYKWDFGDTQIGSGINPKHTYNAIGKYDVRLIVSNEFGCADTIKKLNYIQLGKIKASFTAPEFSCINASINFQNTTQPPTQSVFWDFGDGTNSTLDNPSKRYKDPGFYKVKMVVRTEDCIDSITREIEIKERLGLDFKASTLISCKAPLTVTFTNLTPGDNNYTWQFGDKATANTKNTSHTYTREGNYTVTLTGKNSSGCSETVTKNIIQIGPPNVTLNVPEGGCAPYTHQFSASFSPEFKIQKYQWNFGDGGTSNSNAPSHKFTKPGNYSVSLVYTTTDGCTDSIKIKNAIKVGTPPKVNFEANPLNTCARIPIFFTDLSINVGDSLEWKWDFGDGGKSIVQNPEYIYQDTGMFDVKLVVINNGCADSITFEKYIHIDPPIAKFTYKQNCKVSGNIKFTNTSIGADTWEWDFGDGSGSVEKNPLHVYTKKGDYTVILTVKNKRTGCNFTKQTTIRVIEEFPDFTSDVRDGCKNIPVNFTIKGVNPENIKLYKWDFGDGTSKNLRDTAISYFYATAGVYDVSLTITDNNNCNTSIIKKIYVKIVGSTSVFRALDPVVCKNELVTFFDSSYTFGSGKIVNWEWNFGDGSPIQNLENGPFIHRYADTGFYSVSLKVTDERGCIDSIFKEKEVRVPYVKADFLTDSLSCTYQKIQFKNLSAGQGLSYLWDFGDYQTNSNPNVNHNYTEEGIYSVNLAVKDVYGCQDVAFQKNVVTIMDPLAKLTVNDIISDCPPLIVQFGNLSEKFKTYEWDFGDKTNSVLFAPSHFYGEVGTFKAVLTVKGGVGCVSSDSKEVIVKGPTGSFTYDILEGCVPLTVYFKAETKFSDNLRWDFNDGNSSTIVQGIIPHTYELPGFYEPKLILTDSAGCRFPIKGPDTIRVYGAKAAFSYDTTQFCTAQNLQFYNKSFGNDKIVKYLWSFGDNTFSDSENPIQVYKTPGFYNTSLSVTTQRGCKDTFKLSSPINIKETPDIEIMGNNETCVNSNMQFSGLVLKSDTSHITWKWDFGNGQIGDTKIPPKQSFNTEGVYTVKVNATSASGCSDSSAHLITVYALPDIKINGENVICLDNTTTISATGASIYSWSPTATLTCADCASTVASPHFSTEYKVIGISDKGCLSGDSIMVEVKRPFEIKVSNNDTICVGQTVQLFANGTDNYIWSPTSNMNDASSPNPIVAPAISTTYRVVGQDSKKCFTDTGYVAIDVFKYPTVNAGEDKSINVGSTVTITPIISSDVTNIVWSPTNGVITNDDKGVITLMPRQTITYKIAVKNAGGCLSLDKVTVFVLCNNANVFIPNTFSPNGDGVNDVFFPHGTGVFKIKNLSIFNRWGQLVFDRSNFMANDITAGWDGTLKGKKLNSDVFVYMLSVVCENNEILNFKGDVTLIR